METDQTIEFVPLVGFENDYEIMKEYPNVIRKKSNQQIVNERINVYGYIDVSLNSYTYKKHRLIAKQFIPNPNNLPQVDHINHNKADNRIENLRWCDNSANNRNRLSYNGVQVQYVDELPEDVIYIDEFNGWEFENYYIGHNLNVYYDTGGSYRILYKVKDIYVTMRDINNKKRTLNINKLSRQFL